MDCIGRVWTVYRESVDWVKGEYGLGTETFTSTFAKE